ncbi:MAG: sodium pump decarboxylase [Clostridiales bacterium]|nr:sodium pump decarboxylase [Clostridiales bacterium]
MDKLIAGLGVAGVGMLVVFTGLVILIGFIKVLALFSGEKKPKKAEKKPAETKAVIPTPAPVAPAAPVAEGIPADVIAAITAAIAAVWDGGNGFVVRRVKRISNAPAWSRAGREEQTYSRF